MKIAENEIVRATRSPAGAATMRLRLDGEACEAEAWGPGADWCLENLGELLGRRDDPSGFECAHPLVHDLARKMGGMRFCSSHAVLELLVPTILEQKVTGTEALRSFRALVRRYGEPAPGPFGLLLQPGAATLADLPYTEFHPLGIERKRADTIRRVARRAGRLETLYADHGADAQRLLMTIPGIGPWTSAIVAQAAWGDPDAVIVGDFHFPNIVAWALAREPRASDERMLQLLEPFRGHRGRAVRLLVHSGIRAPKFGPRHRIRDFAAF
jgi:3-methyladenine DNA glycosylase/8-oxoguanine DNA glycosylase